jgi:S-adenosylmethionine decarboxylase
MEAKIWNYSGWINDTDPEEIKQNFNQLLAEAGFTILGVNDHHFEPQGYSCLWLLAESHFAVHTFPEEGATYIELSSCNEEKQYNFMNDLPNKFDILITEPDETHPAFAMEPEPEKTEESEMETNADTSKTDG